MFIPQEFIRRKRDKQNLSKEEIENFITGITNNTISEAQIAAFTMAVFLNGMKIEESIALTLAMCNSGKTMQWKHLSLNGPIIDKHSTGGVGDTVSLMLGPLFAACGGYNPMISGRGLGHTGGTLDKLASIPGYNPFPNTELLEKTVKEAGTAIIGQTDDLAPADKRIYATRDVTATVESIPLITASILSKKLAGGLDCLVMDVKAGNGAFMPSYEKSKALAESIVKIGSGAGLPITALITDMNQSLAPAAGNAVEVLCAIDYLTCKKIPNRLNEVTLSLCAEGLLLAKLANSLEDAKNKLTKALERGKAAEHFAKMVSLLGGPNDLIENPDKHLKKAPIIKDLKSQTSGVINSYNTRELGLAVVALGGGRLRSDQKVNPSVGLTNIAEVGKKIEKGEPILTIHAQTEKELITAEKMILNAIKISQKQKKQQRLISKKITSKNS